jgi:Holliday junction resolvase
MSRGITRERALKAVLESQDHFVVRAAGSLGNADLVALKAGKRPMLIEVKSDAHRPYTHFGPARRAELRLAAELAGADAWLVWWPPYRDPVWISSDSWPGAQKWRRRRDA